MTTLASAVVVAALCHGAPHYQIPVTVLLVGPTPPLEKVIPMQTYRQWSEKLTLSQPRFRVVFSDPRGKVYHVDVIGIHNFVSGGRATLTWSGCPPAPVHLNPVG